MCKACRVAYKQAHHARASSDASTTPAPVETHRRGADELIVDYLRAHPCVARGEADVMVVEFDHLGEKLFSSPAGIRDRLLQALLYEMAKCGVVCANCHGAGPPSEAVPPRGGSSTVEPRPSKALTRVRLPSAALGCPSGPLEGVRRALRSWLRLLGAHRATRRRDPTSTPTAYPGTGRRPPTRVTHRGHPRAVAPDLGRSALPR